VRAQRALLWNGFRLLAPRGATAGGGGGGGGAALVYSTCSLCAGRFHLYAVHFD
jgi:16S rRNA C967 or C1407 C5-methylase (RsmB/RsmF family)